MQINGLSRSTPKKADLVGATTNLFMSMGGIPRMIMANADGEKTRVCPSNNSKTNTADTYTWKCKAQHFDKFDTSKDKGGRMRV